MKTKLIMLVLSFPLLMLGITLPECIQQAEAQYAAGANAEIYRNQEKLSNSGITSGRYPQLSITAYYKGQSESTEINLGELPFEADFPQQSKTSYDLSLQMQQMVYDGGLISQNSKLSELQYKTRQVGLEGELLKRNLQTAGYYYQILLFRRQEEILNLHKDNLTAELNKIEAAITAGMMDNTGSLLIRDQIWQLAEEVLKVNYQKYDLMAKLTRITGILIKDNSELEIYEAELLFPEEINRPELKALDLQSEMERTLSSIAAGGLLPRLSLNGAYSYGNPGYDIFAEDAHAYWRAGLNFQWNIWDWGSLKKQKAIHLQQAEVLQNTKTSSREAIELNLMEIDNEMRRLRENLKLYSERHKLLLQVVSGYETRLEAGIISAEEYLQQFNKLKEVELKQATAEIQLSFKQITELFIMGGIL